MSLSYVEFGKVDLSDVFLTRLKMTTQLLKTGS